MQTAAFGIWITGLPASGKSTIVFALRPQLEALGLTVDVLESDAVRRLLTPQATYSEEERDLFYRALAFTGQRLVAHGVTVLFDATASRQAYRDLARAMIPRFIEVAVECPGDDGNIVVGKSDSGHRHDPLLEESGYLRVVSAHL